MNDSLKNQLAEANSDESAALDDRIGATIRYDTKARGEVRCPSQT